MVDKRTENSKTTMNTGSIERSHPNRDGLRG